MTLTDARAGSRVTFRNGGTAVIERMVTTSSPVILIFKGYSRGATYSYHPDGTFSAVGPHLLDIIAIAPAPMSAEERLAKIRHELLLIWKPGKSGSEVFDEEIMALSMGWVRRLIALATEAGHG